jgi:hypothetical protein
MLWEHDHAIKQVFLANILVLSSAENERTKNISGRTARRDSNRIHNKYKPIPIACYKYERRVQHLNDATSTQGGSDRTGFRMNVQAERSQRITDVHACR